MSKVIIVSNRLPVSIRTKEGGHVFEPSSGGLVSAVSTIFEQENSLWIGWPGLEVKSREDKAEISSELAKEKMRPVFLEQSVMNKYYSGFSNNTIWPLFHYFPKLTSIEPETWAAYKKANEAFYQEVIRHASEDDIIWIHDYHLFLLPMMLHKKMPQLKIGFFLHIPFPSYEIFRILPWRAEILNGILGADLVGFHTYDDMRHFLSATNRILSLSSSLGVIEAFEHNIKIDTFPIGIDYEKYESLVTTKPVKEEIENYRKKFRGIKLILSVDRLDLSKGIPEKLKAFEHFLEHNPEYKGNCSLIMVVVPSRTQVQNYKVLKSEIERQVGRINGIYGRIDWTPIHYLYRSVSNEMLAALYAVSDAALVTPLRDGMNLVSKEYIACKPDNKGVLILSEMAGASKELSEAVIVNPYNIEQVSQAIHTALTMPEMEQKARMVEMKKLLQKNDVNRWSRLFIEKLERIVGEDEQQHDKIIDVNTVNIIHQKYLEAHKRIIFLDYDGTLVRFYRDPKEAKPDKELLGILKALATDKKNKIVLISGRDKVTLSGWMEDLSIDMITEHGVWTKEHGVEWMANARVENKWKRDFLPLFEEFTYRTPGTFIEDKDFSIAWHYRQADNEFGQMRARELISTLTYLISNKDLQIMEGKKVVELKHASVNKGVAASQWLMRDKYDFILALGDDYTDEDIFKAMPEEAVSIKIGAESTSASYRLPSYKEVRKLLSKLSGLEGFEIASNAPSNVQAFF